MPLGLLSQRFDSSARAPVCSLAVTCVQQLLRDSVGSGRVHHDAIKRRAHHSVGFRNLQSELLSELRPSAQFR